MARNNIKLNQIEARLGDMTSPERFYSFDDNGKRVSGQAIQQVRPVSRRYIVFVTGVFIVVSWITYLGSSLGYW